jgi:hypothetical protein
MRPLSDMDYEAKWDAQTLAQAETIRADPNRLNNAKTAAQRMASEQEENAKAMKKVAGKSIPGKKETALPGYTNPAKIDKPLKAGSGFNVFQKI